MTFPNTGKRVEKMAYNRRFLIIFEVFGNVVKTRTKEKMKNKIIKIYA